MFFLDKICISYRSRDHLIVRVLSLTGLIVSFLFAAIPTFINAQGIETQTETSAEAVQPPTQEQRTELERQLAELEKQIEEHQEKIEGYQKEGKNLKSEISGLNAKIDKLNLQIKAVNLTLKKLNEDIVKTQRNINQTENKIENYKYTLSRSVRNLYEADSQNLMEILLANTRLSNFFNDINNILLVQNNIQTALTDIVKLRQELLAQKQELSEEKTDAENLKAIQQSQKTGVEGAKKQKDTLLKVTKGKESEYQKLLKKTQETAAQIRIRIFELLGGGELTFEKAYDYAKLAERATGVRAALILAVLHRESLFGKNTGRCSYKTAMNPKDKPIFLEIVSKLGMDSDSIVAKVSCANRDGAYGGAMGPAQFIPSTWKIFEAQIAAMTGNNPPSPWNHADAFMATALYLKKYGADDGYEKKSAAIYYCGSNWRRYACSYYANRVIETAKKFQQDIDFMNA